MDDSTFDYLKPSDAELTKMQRVRTAAKMFARVIEQELPEGPDKTYVLRKLRDVAMWANVALTRYPDGSPRSPSRDIESELIKEYPPDHPVKGDLGSVPS